MSALLLVRNELTRAFHFYFSFKFCQLEVRIHFFSDFLVHSFVHSFYTIYGLESRGSIFLDILCMFCLFKFFTVYGLENDYFLSIG